MAFDLNGMNERPVRILGIGGSMREGSNSLIALDSALRLAADSGAETTLADVNDLNLPIFRADWSVAEFPPALAWLLDEARSADAYILSSPTYHGTVSGAVKNVLDALNFLKADTPPYFGGKPVGLLAYGGASAINTINALHHAARGLKGLAVPTCVTVSRNAIDADAREIHDGMVRHRLLTMTSELIELAHRLRQPALTSRSL